MPSSGEPLGPASPEGSGLQTHVWKPRRPHLSPSASEQTDALSPRTFKHFCLAGFPEVSSHGWAAAQRLGSPGCLLPTHFQTKPLTRHARHQSVGVEPHSGRHCRPPPGSWLSHTWAFSVLQVLGFEIDALNSVQFSNHTGKALAPAVAAEGVWA